MSEPAFTLALSAALNRLIVPPLPEGFADRLSARIEAGDLPAELDMNASPIPSARRPFAGSSGWRRSGRILATVTALGLATATAAASGFFGQPIYVPVVSDALAKAKLVDLPKAKATPPTERRASKDAAAADEAKPEVTGKDAVLNQIAKNRADPEFKALPAAERAARMKQDLLALVSSGKASNEDVKAAWAELAEARKDKLKAGREAAAKAGAMEQPKRSKLTPEQKAKVRDVYEQLSSEQRRELRELRLRLREAAPADKRAVRQEIRAFWKRSGIQPAQDVPSEGNLSPVR